MVFVKWDAPPLWLQIYKGAQDTPELMHYTHATREHIWHLPFVSWLKSEEIKPFWD